MIKTAYVLVLIYSPAGPYFNGFTFEVRDSQQACVAEIGQRIGGPIPNASAWVPQMMGPIPKVVGGFCAEGSFADEAFDAKGSRP